MIYLGIAKLRFIHFNLTIQHQRRVDDLLIIIRDGLQPFTDLPLHSTFSLNFINVKYYLANLCMLLMIYFCDV